MMEESSKVNNERFEVIKQNPGVDAEGPDMYKDNFELMEESSDIIDANAV